MRAIGYLRVSTADQAREGVGLDAQRARVAAWCAAHGHDLADRSVHVDAGVSGKAAANRPGLHAALAEACRTGGVLVVYSLSRLARSTRDALMIFDRIEKAGAHVASVTESLDTSSPTGRLIFRVMAVFAEFERELIAERTQAAVDLKRARGERLGEVPYGWAVGPDGKRLVEVPAEQAVLDALAAWRVAGWSLRRVAAELNARGVAAKKGGAWCAGTVGHLLKRRGA